MAVDTSPKFFNFIVSTNKTLNSDVSRKSKHPNKNKNISQSRKILKSKNSALNWYNKSIVLHLQQPGFLDKHCILKKKYFHSSISKNYTMQDTEMNDVLGNVCFERRCDVESHPSHVNSRFNSPIEEDSSRSSRSSKSPNSIEDLNKEIERLFLNNEQFGFTSFIWDKEEVAEGRRAPIADMLHCYKGYNRRKKRRSATALGIRNYNESDSSNGISSPDDNSGCEEYSKIKLIESLDPSIIIPVPVGKAEIDQSVTFNLSGPFSGNKLQLSEDSAFAPIKSIPRCQSTPPEDIDVNNEGNKIL